MTSKEKSMELVDKFIQGSITEAIDTKYFHKEPYTMAVQCAKICVQEIIEALTTSTRHLLINQVDEYELVKDFNYWKEVLNHLNEM